MGLESYLPRKRDLVSGGIGFILGIIGGDRIKGYINNKVDGISERIGENIARKVYEKQNPSNPACGTSTQQAYTQTVDPTQQFYNAILEQNKTLTEALLEQTDAIKKMPDRVGYKVEKSVTKALANKNKPQ